MGSYISKVMWAWRHAFRGIWYVLIRKPSPNIPYYYVFTGIVLVLSWYLHISFFEFFAIIFMALFVLCAEMINTALEEIVNLIKKEHSQEAKIAKDAAAGMVALATIGYMLLAFVIFGYNLIAR
jgi:diacylglycerol kinase